MRLSQASRRALPVTTSIRVRGARRSPAKAGPMRLLEKNATKLNADKTRFDPRPVGVLLTFRFRDCSHPLPVRYERTPSVPGCQYLFPEFLQTAPRWHERSLSSSTPNARPLHSLIRLSGYMASRLL